MQNGLVASVTPVMLATLLSFFPAHAFFVFHPPLHAVPLVDRPSLHQQPRQLVAASSSGLNQNNSGAAVTTKENRRQEAKDTFLRNLERKSAGENVPTKVLDANVSTLVKAASTTKEGRHSWTTVNDLPSWRGTWKICHAPHIEQLGGVLLSSFPSIEYDFTDDDGRMVSHSRYESSLFGSGWLSADGRVLALSPPATDAGKSELGTVQVVFERFWWDRNGQEQPTKGPPISGGVDVDTAEADVVSKLVQGAGRALFVKGLSIFPVLYLDDDLCVFEFKAAGTVVVSQRL